MNLVTTDTLYFYWVKIWSCQRAVLEVTRIFLNFVIFEVLSKVRIGKDNIFQMRRCDKTLLNTSHSRVVIPLTLITKRSLLNTFIKRRIIDLIQLTIILTTTFMKLIRISLIYRTSLTNSRTLFKCLIINLIQSTCYTQWETLLDSLVIVLIWGTSCWGGDTFVLTGGVCLGRLACGVYVGALFCAGVVSLGGEAEGLA